MPNMIGPPQSPRDPLPVSNAHFAAPPAQGSRSSDDLFATLRKLARHYWIVLAVAATAFVVAMIAVRSLTPLYTATAEILIGAPVNDAGSSLAPGERQSVDSEAVQSQARIVTSRTIARRVVEKLALDQDPDFNPYLREDKSLLDTILMRNSSEDKRQAPREEQVALTTEVLLSKVSAGPTDRSHVLNVQTEVEDAHLAARITNAFAELYIEQMLVRQTTMAQQANTWLGGQLDELRRQVDANERAVEEYRRKHGLYEANSSTVSDQQLAELNTQLVLAESEKAQAEARLSQAQQVLNSGGELDSIPEVVNSPLIQALEEKQAEIARQAAELSSVYGPMHPRITNIQAQQEDTKRKIDAEVRKTRQQSSAIPHLPRKHATTRSTRASTPQNPKSANRMSIPSSFASSSARRTRAARFSRTFSSATRGTPPRSSSSRPRHGSSLRPRHPFVRASRPRPPFSRARRSWGFCSAHFSFSSWNPSTARSGRATTW